MTLLGGWAEKSWIAFSNDPNTTTHEAPGERHNGYSIDVFRRQQYLSSVDNLLCPPDLWEFPTHPAHQEEQLYKSVGSERVWWKMSHPAHAEKDHYLCIAPLYAEYTDKYTYAEYRQNTQNAHAGKVYPCHAEHRTSVRRRMHTSSEPIIAINNSY